MRSPTLVAFMVIVVVAMMVHLVRPWLRRWVADVLGWVLVALVAALLIREVAAP